MPAIIIILLLIHGIQGAEKCMGKFSFDPVSGSCYVKQKTPPLNDPPTWEEAALSCSRAFDTSFAGLIVERDFDKLASLLKSNGSLPQISLIGLTRSSHKDPWYWIDSNPSKETIVPTFTNCNEIMGSTIDGNCGALVWPETRASDPCFQAVPCKSNVSAVFSQFSFTCYYKFVGDENHCKDRGIQSPSGGFCYERKGETQRSYDEAYCEAVYENSQLPTMDSAETLLLLATSSPVPNLRFTDTVRFPVPYIVPLGVLVLPNATGNLEWMRVDGSKPFPQISFLNWSLNLGKAEENHCGFLNVTAETGTFISLPCNLNVKISSLPRHFRESGPAALNDCEILKSILKRTHSGSCDRNPSSFAVCNTTNPPRTTTTVTTTTTTTKIPETTTAHPQISKMSNITVNQSNVGEVLKEMDGAMKSIGGKNLNNQDLTDLSILLQGVTAVSLTHEHFNSTLTIVDDVIDANETEMAAAQKYGGATNRVLESIRNLSINTDSPFSLFMGANMAMLNQKAGHSRGKRSVNDTTLYRGFCLTTGGYVPIKNRAMSQSKTGSWNEELMAGLVLPDSQVLGVTVAFVIYKNAKLFQTGNTSDVPRVTPDRKSCALQKANSNFVVSAIRSFTNGSQAEISENALLGFNKKYLPTQMQGLHSAYQTGFWNYVDWSTNGCSLHSDSGGIYEAKCSHLTDFALLVNSVASDPSLCDRTLQAVGEVLSSFSVIALAFLGFLIVWNWCSKKARLTRKRRQQTQNILGLPFVLTLLSFFLCFILFSDQTNLGISDDACYAAAAVLYTLLLSVIFWTGYQALGFYRKFVSVFGQKRWVEIISGPLFSNIISFGIPIIITVSVRFAKDDFFKRNDSFCWLNPSYVAFAVVVPISLILVIDIILTGLVLHRLFLSKFGDASSRVIQNPQAKRRLLFRKVIAIVLMEVILGFPWILQYLSMGSVEVKGVHYLFTILNTSQGFFLGLLYMISRVGSLARSVATFRRIFKPKAKEVEDWVPMAREEESSTVSTVL